MYPPQDVADGAFRECPNSLEHIAVDAEAVDRDPYGVGRHARVLDEVRDTQGLPWPGKERLNNRALTVQPGRVVLNRTVP